MAAVRLGMSRETNTAEEHLSQIGKAVDVLWSDVHAAREGISGESIEFALRTLVRTVFAFVEGYTIWLTSVAEELLVQLGRNAWAARH